MRIDLRQWRAASSEYRTPQVVLAAAALTVAAVGAGSIVPALAPAVSASVAVDQSIAATIDPAPAAAEPVVQTEAWVDHAFELQPNYYYCGPAATRVALSAQGKVYTEDHLVTMLGTTTAGTPSAFDITRVLNEQLGQNRYRTVELSQRQVTPDQIAQLKSDVVTTLSRGNTLVANVLGGGRDTTGHLRSYPTGHYLNAVGYLNGGDTVRIADSADPAVPYYDVSVTELARWVGSRGYSAN